MKKYKLIIIGLLIINILTLSLYFLETNKNNEYNENNNQNIEISSISEKFNYKQYMDLSIYIKDNFKMNDYQLLFSSDNKDLVGIGGEYPFSNRIWMSLPNMDTASTQNKFIFQDSIKSNTITITISYTPNYIGSELVYFMPTNDYPTPKKKNEFMIATYKNLILSIYHTSTDFADYELTKDFLITLEDIINKYEKEHEISN